MILSEHLTDIGKMFPIDIQRHMIGGKEKEKNVAKPEEDAHSIKEKIDLVLAIVGRFDFYINSTNAKASLIFAWNGIVIGTLLLKYKDFLELYPKNHQLIIELCLLCIGICAVISNLIAFQVIFPFLKGSNKPSKTSSIFYFGSVSSMKSEEYFEKVSKISSRETLVDITDQGVILAKAADGKMKWMRNSILAVYFQLFFILFLFVFRIISQYVGGWFL